MSIIIDRLFTKPYVESGFIENEKFYNRLVQKRYINVQNFIPAIIIMIFLRILNFNNQYVFFIALGVLLYTMKTNVEENQKKIKFLNNIMFNDYEEPFETKSYLEYDQKLIDFYYDNRWYIDYNLSSYRKSLESTNNLLRITYNLNENLMREPEQLYRNAYMEYKKALNNLHSSIYKMISQQVNNDIFNDNLIILKKLLRKHIEELQKRVIKCGYNLYDINIWSIINPSNIELENDIKTKGYSQHYSFF